MSQLDDLWRALRETPYDRGLLGVLADALIERGDPRGELITVQLDIEHARRHELLALRTRERELLGALHDELVGGLPSGSYKICRGMVAAARLGREWAQATDVLVERTLLEELFLAVAVDPVVAVGHPAARHLKILSLGIPRHLTGIQLGMPHLEELRVLAAPVEACDLVAANPTVRKVLFDRVQLEDGRALLAILPQLVSLRLRSRVSPVVMRGLVDAPLVHVEHLRLPGHECGQFVPALVARDLPRLRELDLRGVELPGGARLDDPVTDDGLRALAASALRPTKLALGVSGVTTRGLAALVASPLAADLEDLTLEQVPLGVADLAALATLPRLANVQLLGCGLDDAAARAIPPAWTTVALWSNPELSPGARAELVERFGGDVQFEPPPEWIDT